MKRKFDLSVYFVLDPACCGGRDALVVARAALVGGVSMVQLRDKKSPKEDVRALAETLLPLTQEAGALLIINDRVDVAAEIGADGVHLGQGDMDVHQARGILGPDKIIGLTAFTTEQVRAVDPLVVDYIGTGPFFETKTDKGKPVLGRKKFVELMALSSVPAVGIGGITLQNAAEVYAAGADGIAMMRSISEADDPQYAAQQFMRVYKECKIKKVC